MTGKAKTDKKRKNGQLTALGDLLSKYEKPEKNKYVSREFQDFGYRLAMELGDENIRLCILSWQKLWIGFCWRRL